MRSVLIEGPVFNLSKERPEDRQILSSYHKQCYISVHKRFFIWSCSYQVYNLFDKLEIYTI